MKPIELTVQEKKYFCVCSVLQAILRKRGVEISQEEIASNLTHGKDKDGKDDGYIVHDEKIKKFLLRKGFNYSYFGVHETPFNEPDELLKEMCQHDGMIGIGNHVYFLKDFEDPRVKLIDPKNGQEIEKNYFELLKEMRHSGIFGLVKRIS